MDRRTFLTTAGSMLAAGPVWAQKERGSQNWPSYRGPDASGVAEGYPLPAQWNGEEGKGVRWKTPVPGLGHSSPAIWGDRLYVTTAVSGQKGDIRGGLFGDIESVADDTVHQWKVYCLDKKSGKVLWDRTAVSRVPAVKRHSKSTHANPTIATDGRHVVAFFASEGLYCYDPNGRLLWKKDLGVLDSGYFQVPSAQWEFASSPIIDGEKVIVQCDVQKGSFLAALRIKDGSQIWRTERDDVPTWSTPTVVREGGRAQVVVNGYRHSGGYDLETGKEIWRLGGGGDIPVPTPVFGDGLIFLSSAHGRVAPIVAVKTTAKGDVTLPEDVPSGEHVAWRRPRDASYMSTPILYRGHLYVTRWNGILGCYEAKSGKMLYQERLGTGRSAFTASGVAGDGKLYLPSEEGDVYVVQAGPTFKLLATNPLGGMCLATPAISEGVLFFRTRDDVLAIGPAEGGR